MRRMVKIIVLLTCAASMGACQLGLARGNGAEPAQAGAAASPQSDSGPVIENDSALPDTYPHAVYAIHFRAHSVSVPHWQLQKGALPPGLKLEDNGLLHGQPERTGEFQFTLSVTDGSSQQVAQKAFLIRVRSALTLNWKAAARVNGGRIEGSVEVTNTTPDDMDLTFVAMAVASNGRATAIGYQHFVLQRGTIAKELPFGENLPHGGYVVHVDAVGEVARKNLIYRERLQSSTLQVTVGP
jgi:hypothetical protein